MAQNSRRTAKKRGPGRPFKPGRSGNPGGRPKVPQEVREAARALTLKALRTLETIMDNKRAPASAKVAAAVAILNRGWGKPVQGVEQSGNVTVLFTEEDAGVL